MFSDYIISYWQMQKSGIFITAIYLNKIYMNYLQQAIMF